MKRQNKLRILSLALLVSAICIAVFKYGSPDAGEAIILDTVPRKKVETTTEGHSESSRSRVKTLETESEASATSEDISHLERIRRIRESKPVPNFPMFDETGTLSNLVIDRYKIDDSNAVQIQELLSEFFSSARQLFQSRIEVDTLRSQPTEGIRAYRCAPFESEMTPIFDELARKIELQVGSGFADQILATFPVDSFYSSMGRNATSVKVIEDTTGMFGGKVRFEIEVRDGQTGLLRARATMTESLLNRNYPGFFHDGAVANSEDRGATN